MWKPSASLWHRLIGMKPGHAPLWLVSKSKSSGVDAMTGVPLIVMLAGIGLVKCGYHAGWYIIRGAVVWILVVFVPFDSCERKARAALHEGLTDKSSVES